MASSRRKYPRRAWMDRSVFLIKIAACHRAEKDNPQQVVSFGFLQPQHKLLKRVLDDRLQEWKAIECFLQTLRISLQYLRFHLDHRSL